MKLTNRFKFINVVCTIVCILTNITEGHFLCPHKKIQKAIVCVLTNNTALVCVLTNNKSIVCFLTNFVLKPISNMTNKIKVIQAIFIVCCCGIIIIFRISY